MNIKSETLQKYLIQIRRISEHREKGAELNIRRLYKKLIKDLNGFLGIKYAQLSEDDILNYSILQKKGEYASFLEEVQLHTDTITPKISEEITNIVNETYKKCYEGMIYGVNKAIDNTNLKEIFMSVKATTPEIIKRAVENPISGLTLKDTLRKHRNDIIYNIKQNIGIGLINGDRMSEMAKRIEKCLKGDYEKSIIIVRTEVHRVREAGFHDSAENINKELNVKDNNHIYISKTWRTMKDQRVRPNRGIGKKKSKNKADHTKMEGVTIQIDEMFDLGGGIRAKAPGLSGDAKNDINCRCFLEYDIEEN